MWINYKYFLYKYFTFRVNIYIYIYIYIPVVSDKCLYEYMIFTQCESYLVLSVGACTVVGRWELSHPAWLTVHRKSDHEDCGFL